MSFQIIKELAPAIWQALQKSKRILLHGHPNPDQDSLGSALAFYHLLKGLGKEVVVIGGDSPIPDFARFLPGGEIIEAKNFFQVDLTEFDLFLIVDSSTLKQISDRGEVKFPRQLKTIAIDHHRVNDGFADLNLVVPDYPATAQILFALFNQWPVEFNREIALNLFMGIYYDTGGFKHEGTTAATLEAAATLAKWASDFASVISAIDSNHQPETLVYLRLLLNSLEIHGAVALVTASFSDLLTAGLSTETASTPSSLPATLVSVRDWIIGASVVEKEPGRVRISLRARADRQYDVSRVAAVLGGSGHRLAAGASVAGDIGTVKGKLLAAICQIYPDLLNSSISPRGRF